MGGNVKVGKWIAEPIDLCFPRDVRGDILEVMYDISRQMATYNAQPFGDTHVNMKCFTGSTDILMNSNVSDEELLQFKPVIGDVDMQMKYANKYVFEDLLKKKPQFGNYKVVGLSKHGNEFSVLCWNEVYGEVHQFDFQFVDEPGSTNERFLHCAAWEDVKLGIKGAHHKILLNAVGLDVYKFSIINGLSRRDETPPFNIKDPRRIQTTLFGDISSACKVNFDSFIGVVDLIYRFTPQQHVLPIFEKFCTDIKDRVKDSDANHAAIMYFADKIGIYG